MNGPFGLFGDLIDEVFHGELLDNVDSVHVAVALVNSVGVLLVGGGLELLDHDRVHTGLQNLVVLQETLLVLSLLERAIHL